MPVTIEGNPVTSIGEMAFFFCDSLRNITISNSATGIEGGFHKFTSLTISDSFTSIGDVAFRTCISLTNVTIGNGVKSIGGGAFWSWISLTAVTFLGAAPTIGNYAFEGSLPTIYRKADSKGWANTLADRVLKIITEKP